MIKHCKDLKRRLEKPGGGAGGRGLKLEGEVDYELSHQTTSPTFSSKHPGGYSEKRRSAVTTAYVTPPLRDRHSGVLIRRDAGFASDINNGAPFRSSELRF